MYIDTQGRKLNSKWFPFHPKVFKYQDTVQTYLTTGEEGVLWTPGYLNLLSILHLRPNYWTADLSDFLGATAVIISTSR